jgi:peptidoglycan/xylan/chitin deacetylase (PgdA/CDA1 family)
MSGIFTISLDFELHWGGFEKWPLENYKGYFSNTRRVIPKMLELFAANNVHVTWATVGLLFHDSREELLQNYPKQPPTYKVTKLSALNYIQSEGIGINEEADPYHFAPSIIRLITSTPGQELASHTFGHYYCNEEGQSPDQFRADLQAAQRAASKYGRKLRSLVFPRNQFNEDYLRVCFDEGIRVVRANPRDWFWNINSTHHESLWKRFNRGLDAYLPIGKENIFKISSIKNIPGLPLSVPSSRLLRPYNPKEIFLNDIKIIRIKNEMAKAAKEGAVYHLWWHPHNFGWYPEKSMDALQEIISHFSFCSEAYGMTSLSMGDIAEKISVAPKS